MPETKLLDIDFGSTLTRMTEIRKETEELRKANEELKKSIEETGDATGEMNESLSLNEAHIKALTKEQRTLNKVVEDTIKIQNSQKGSIAANRAELSRLTQEYIKLGNPTKEQTERIKNLSDTLKLQEAAIGDTRRNVGNYGEAINQAFGGLKVFGVELNQVTGFLRSKQNELKTIKTALNSTSTATGGVTQSFKLMKGALASIGIGVAIAAIGLLVENWDKISDVIGLTNKKLSEFNKLKAEGITKYQDEITKVQLLKTEYQQTNTTQERRRDIIKQLKEENPAYFGQLDEEKTSIEDLSEAYTRYADVLKLKGTIEVFAREISELSAQKIQNQTKDILEQTTEFEKLVIGFKSYLGITTLAEASIEGLNKAQENQLKTDKELDEQIKSRNESMIALLKTLDEAGGDPAEANKKFVEAQKAFSEAARKEIGDIEGLKTAMNDLDIAIGELSTTTEEITVTPKVELPDIETPVKEIKSRLKMLLEDDEDLSLFNAIGFNDDKLNFALEQANGFASSINNIFATQNQNRIAEIEEQRQAEIERIEDTILDEQDKASAIVNINEKFNNQKLKQEKEFARKQKAIQIIQTIINGAMAVTNALATVQPFIPLGVAAAALAAATTAIQVGTIAGQKFAEGGEIPGKVYDIGGRSHSQGGTKFYGDDGNVIEMEKGEKAFVLKRDASRYIEQFSTLNQLFGGRSWTGRPVHHAALGGGVASTFDGGFAARESRNNVDLKMTADIISRAIKGFQPVVRVTEINRVNKGVQSSVKVSEL